MASRPTSRPHVRGSGVADRGLSHSRYIRGIDKHDDWHVVELVYELVTEANHDITFGDDAAAVELVTDVFDARLESGELRVSPKVHFETELEAQQAVEPVLREWEMYHALQAGAPEIRFVFKTASSVDRSRADGGRIMTEADAIGPIRGAPEVRIEYPEPPRGQFNRSPDVAVLYARWELYKRGQDSLTNAVYASLTFIESRFGRGDRAEAATALGISRKVLTQMSKLAQHGDPTTARKITGGAQRALAEAEKVWLDAPLLLVVSRVGEVAAGEVAADRPTPLKQLTLADLPQL